MDFDAIRAEMAKNGEANLADLEYVSEETFSELQKEAKQYDDAEALALGTWRGNNLIVNGRVWTWQDTPGSQCGRPAPGNIQHKRGQVTVRQASAHKGTSGGK